MSLTDDKIEDAIEAMWIDIEKFYDKLFEAEKVPWTVWGALLDMEDRLTKALEKRPLTSMEIRALMAAHISSFKKLCLDAKKSGGTTARSGTPAG